MGYAVPIGARSPIFPAHADKEQVTNAAKSVLTPEQRSSLRALFKDDMALKEGALRVYASDVSLRRGPMLAMVRPRMVEQVRRLMC